MGFGDVCIEGNALTVLKRIKKSEIDILVIGNIIIEIMDRVTRSIYWVEDIPLDVEAIVIKEQRW
ncbi:hypothetical protein Golax_025894 [Gossypium laxum]|uniref:Uncharacterized protein n=1 Tax=Gossypium laxum TaxID=34288 RepID=A0A7J9B4F6_9ROSI|nr:hypothetical protein [Gossypium laxum]